MGHCSPLESWSVHQGAVEAVNPGTNASGEQKECIAKVNTISNEHIDGIQQPTTAPSHPFRSIRRKITYWLYICELLNCAHRVLFGQGSAAVFPMVLDKSNSDGISG